MTEPSPTHVALFGGSFNPPHICHTLATLWVLQTQPVDEVWWIPTFQHAFDKNLADFESRRMMCEAATADFHRVRVETIERELGGASRTIDTVQALMERHGELSFSLVVGADILGEVERWKNWQGLMKLVDLIVVGRRGYEHDAQPEGLALELPDISSTIIRSALAECDYSEVSAWIPRKVLKIISARRLYLGPTCR